MQFLDDTLQSRSRISNVSTPIEIEDSTSPTAETPPLIEVTENNDSNKNQLNFPQPLRKMPPLLPKKKLNLGCKAQENDVDKVIDFLQSKPTKRDFDGIDHLFLSYADTFRKFQPMTQAMLKIELATLFARTEMKELGTHLSSTPLYSDNSSHSTTSATEFQLRECTSPIYAEMNSIGEMYEQYWHHE